MIDLLAKGLLRRHVGDRADGRTGTGQVGGLSLLLGIFAGAGVCGELGEAEVEDLGMTLTGDEDVGRLDVPMDDPLRVGLGEGIGYLDAPLDDPVVGDRLPRDLVFERLPFEQLHGDERDAVVLIDLVDGADVGVVERRGGSRLAQEALERSFVFGHALGEELECHLAPQLGVLRGVDDTHPATPETIEYPIVRDDLTDHDQTPAPPVRDRTHLGQQNRPTVY